jgi:hypothetical protein
MSLISEALRKARAEAAEREGRGRGIPRALVLPPKKWRSGPGLLLVLLLVVVAAFGGAAVAWWALARRPATTGARPDAAARMTSPPTKAKVPAAAVPAPPAAAPAAPAPSPSAPPTEGSERTALPAAAAAGASPTQPATTPPPARTTEKRDHEAVARGAETAQTEPSRGERSFTIDANLGYAKLHLDYIVYRPGSPFASINGGQVIVGSVIDGFSVDEISQDFVRLRDRHGTVVLRVH